MKYSLLLLTLILSSVIIADDHKPDRAMMEAKMQLDFVKSSSSWKI